MAASRGRCAGCGYVGSVGKVSSHCASCQKFVRLFYDHPEKALEPAAEYVRWQADQVSDEHLAAREMAREDRARANKERGRKSVEDQLTRWRAAQLPPAVPVLPPPEGRLQDGDSLAHRVARERSS